VSVDRHGTFIAAFTASHSELNTSPPHTTAHTHACTHARTHARTHAHTHAHAHTHTHHVLHWTMPRHMHPTSCIRTTPTLTHMRAKGRVRQGGQ
jgi:hypothetical protein